ncbi:MAG: 50S ribosomal protein L13 [Kyrpidia sp.]|nr:50S ribosomal protein L13 [Kyrpidia sp.]
MQTTFMKKKEDVKRRWYVIDAAGQTVGRLATEIATILRGKHKPDYTPHVDTGDHVIVINAEKVVFTGKKWTDKLYRRHSGYPGGLKEMRAKDVLARYPERILYFAVRGMLPHTPLGRRQLKKLKVYAGPEHPHEAQQPVVWTPGTTKKGGV